MVVEKFSSEADFLAALKRVPFSPADVNKGVVGYYKFLMEGLGKNKGWAVKFLRDKQQVKYLVDLMEGNKRFFPWYKQYANILRGLQRIVEIPKTFHQVKEHKGKDLLDVNYLIHYGQPRFISSWGKEGYVDKEYDQFLHSNKASPLHIGMADARRYERWLIKQAGKGTGYEKVNGRLVNVFWEHLNDPRLMKALEHLPEHQRAVKRVIAGWDTRVKVKGIEITIPRSVYFEEDKLIEWFKSRYGKDVQATRIINELNRGVVISGVSPFLNKVASSVYYRVVAAKKRAPANELLVKIPFGKHINKNLDEVPPSYYAVIENLRHRRVWNTGNTYEQRFPGFYRQWDRAVRKRAWIRDELRRSAAVGDEMSPRDLQYHFDPYRKRLRKALEERGLGHIYDRLDDEWDFANVSSFSDYSAYRQGGFGTADSFDVGPHKGRIRLGAYRPRKENDIDYELMERIKQDGKKYLTAVRSDFHAGIRRQERARVLFSGVRAFERRIDQMFPREKVRVVPLTGEAYTVETRRFGWMNRFLKDALTEGLRRQLEEYHELMDRAEKLMNAPGMVYGVSLSGEDMGDVEEIAAKMGGVYAKGRRLRAGPGEEWGMFNEDYEFFSMGEESKELTALKTRGGYRTQIMNAIEPKQLRGISEEIEERHGWDAMDVVEPSIRELWKERWNAVVWKGTV